MLIRWRFGFFVVAVVLAGCTPAKTTVAETTAAETTAAETTTAGITASASAATSTRADDGDVLGETFAFHIAGMKRIRGHL